MRRYAQYMRDQVTELLTQFGEIVEFWFDVSGKIDPVACESEAMLELVRSLQPRVILNTASPSPGRRTSSLPKGTFAIRLRRQETAQRSLGGLSLLTAAWATTVTRSPISRPRSAAWRFSSPRPA